MLIFFAVIHSISSVKVDLLFFFVSMEEFKESILLMKSDIKYEMTKVQNWTSRKTAGLEEQNHESSNSVTKAMSLKQERIKMAEIN